MFWTTAARRRLYSGIFLAITKQSRAIRALPLTNTFWICGIFSVTLKLNAVSFRASTELDEISIKDIDLDFIASVTLNDVYDYMAFLSRDKVKNERSREPGIRFAGLFARQKNRHDSQLLQISDHQDQAAGCKPRRGA